MVEAVTIDQSERFVINHFDTQEKKQWFKDTLRRVASEDEVTIVFIKKDGSERTLHGTTNFKSIPKEHHPETGKERKVDKDKLLVIYDVEANGWRSLNYDSIIGVSSMDSDLNTEILINQIQPLLKILHDMNIDKEKQNIN